MMNMMLKTLDYPTQNSLNNIRPVESVLETVIKAALSKDISQNSRTAFVSDLKMFLAWFQGINGEAFSFPRCTASDIVEYKQVLIRQYKSATINRHLSSIKTLFKTALELNLIERDLSQGVKSLPCDALAPKALSDSDSRKLMREVKIRGNKRDKLILGLMLYSGLRCSEVIKLRHVDIKINDRSGFVNVIHSKGGKSRKVPLTLRLRDIISDFYTVVGEDPSPDDKIFIGQRGELSTLAINKIVLKYAEKAGFRASPHQLRHSFAYAFLKQNPSDIVALAQVLGHSNIQTTAIYTQNTFEDLESKIELI